MSQHRWLPIVAGLLLVAAPHATDAQSSYDQSPYDSYNARATVLSRFDRDQDGNLSSQELRNAIVRADAVKAATLEEMARGTLQTQPWMRDQVSIWDAEAANRASLNHAGRWLSCLESLPVVGLDGLVSDVSLMRDLTPWEYFRGDAASRSWALPATTLATPGLPTNAPTATSNNWWQSTTTNAGATNNPGAATSAAPSTGSYTATPTAPGALPTNLLTRPNPLAGTMPGLGLPAASGAAGSSATASNATRSPSTSIASPVGGTGYRADAVLAAQANSKSVVPQFQFGTTKVVGVEAPKPKTEAALPAPQRPKAVAKAGALGPMKFVPPTIKRAGVLSTRPAGIGSRP